MDLKPQNILLTNRHRPVLKVADFGLSQHLRDSGKTGRSFRGSPLYMAPEIFKNERLLISQCQNDAFLKCFFFEGMTPEWTCGHVE